MSWTQLAQLLREGHEIGAHSASHKRLTSLDRADVVEEIRGCKQALEQRLNAPIDFFCYPAGDYDHTVKQMVKASGYRGACTVEPGANHAGCDPLTLKRTEISGFDTRWDFEKKLAGAYDWLHRITQRVQRTKAREHVGTSAQEYTKSSWRFS